MNPTHERLLRYFNWEHLPPHLGAVSRSFQPLAEEIVGRAESGAADPAETTVALRKLVECKDSAVRALL